jgi:hypothetical protein
MFTCSVHMYWCYCYCFLIVGRVWTAVHKTPPLAIIVPQVIGMLLVTLLALLAIRKTTSAIEKCWPVLDKHYQSIICYRRLT